jgi:hypothetical protein
MGRLSPLLQWAFLRLLNIFMQNFTVLTLVDVSETKQFRREPGKERQYQQHQNFVMLLQSIGLRANPMFSRSPVCEQQSLKDLNFGSYYRGLHNVWTFNFSIEYDGAFADALGRQEGLLVEDLHFVPVITGLDETIEFPLAVFDTQSNDYRNTLVYFNQV